MAEAKAEAIVVIGKVADTPEGQKAIQLELAGQAITAKEAIAKESSVVLLPENNVGAANVVAEAMSIISTLNKNKPEVT